MWVVAGVLLALVVIGAIAGFHAGPHAHLLAAIAGVVAAVWLVVMALLGYTHPLLYVLLGADVTLTALLGYAGWRVIKSPHAVAEHDKPPPGVEGKLGVAVGALDPAGVVRVGGEEWTAVSLNGPVPVGGRVQVINAKGVRLEVWNEESPALGTAVVTEEGTSS